MINNMKYILKIFIIVLILLQVFCTQNLSGGSSDHGNAGTIISVFDEDGHLIKGGTFKIIPSNYNPFKNSDVLVISSTFDSSGLIKINELPLDSYNIIIFNGDSSYSNTHSFALKNYDDSLNVILYESGTISLPLDSNILNPGCNYYIDELKLVLDSLISGLLANELKVPKGKYTIKKSDENTVTDSTIFNDITVESGYITDISFYPKAPQGPDTVKAGHWATFYSYFDYKTFTPWIHAEFIEYQFDWGDGYKSSWQNKMESSHYWLYPGTYEVRVHIRYNDSAGSQTPETFISYWSPTSAVVVVKDND